MHLIIKIFLFFLLLACPIQSAAIGKWLRQVISLTNTSYTGNPFELELDATFTHIQSGTNLTLPGYYDGDDTWKIGFMPTKIGDWTYVTSSTDEDLNNKTGTITCVTSSNKGLLKADPENPKKWKLSDGGFIIPLQFRMEFFFEPGTKAEFTAAADFLKNDVKGHIFDTRLLDEERWFNGNRSDYIFSGNHSNHQFDLAVWRRMEERMNILTERGLGAHIMFYSDDAGEPGWKGQSATELLVIRYVVARLCGYPIIWFNTGIDIAEYRSKADLEWWAKKIQALDPYGHPVSSRYGGGSGSIVLSNQTWDSRGDRLAKIMDMRRYFNQSSIPVSMDDAWHEESPEGAKRNKDFTKHDIRRAIWKCVISGGLGAIIRGYDGYFHITANGFEQKFTDDLASGPYLKLINPFIQKKLGDTFGAMTPQAPLASGFGVYCLSNPGGSAILCYSIGVNDAYDKGGGDITLNLSGLKQTYRAIWFDPRTGGETVAGNLDGGSSHKLSCPSNDDWLLLLTLAPVTKIETRPSRPANLKAVPVTPSAIKIVPQPFHSTVTISIYGDNPAPLNGPTLRQLAIYNTKGRLITDLTGQISGVRADWDLSNQPNGLYIIKAKIKP